MTEAEAMRKWCPFGRAPNYTDQGATNRNMLGDGLQTCFCIGSMCMAWRQERKRNPNWKPSPFGLMSQSPKHPDDEEPMYVEDAERGFCGLAGKP